MRKSFANIYRMVLPLALALWLSGCTKAHEQRAAAEHVAAAAELIEQHRYEAALQQLDSVHSLYPRQVEQRRQAKALKDTIVYLQSQLTLRYADSLLQPLLPEADKLLKEFRYDKREGYEDHGQYVYRNLQTGWNTNRCFLQAYGEAVRSLREGSDLGKLILCAASIKADIVRRDPFEHGERRVLNLGHSFAHALEHEARLREAGAGQDVPTRLAHARHQRARATDTPGVQTN